MAPPITLSLACAGQHHAVRAVGEGAVPAALVPIFFVGLNQIVHRCLAVEVNAKAAVARNDVACHGSQAADDVVRDAGRRQHIRGHFQIDAIVGVVRDGVGLDQVAADAIAGGRGLTRGLEVDAKRIVLDRIPGPRSPESGCRWKSFHRSVGNQDANGVAAGRIAGVTPSRSFCTRLLLDSRTMASPPAKLTIDSPSTTERPGRRRRTGRSCRWQDCAR